MSDTLFDVDPAQVQPAEPAERLSTGRRLTLRQLDALRAGTHPLGMLPKILPGHLPLHPDAPPADDRTATGPRCGTCQFRVTLGHHNRTYAKCTFGRIENRPAPRISHGAATDVRAWWPACRDYRQTEPMTSWYLDKPGNVIHRGDCANREDARLWRRAEGMTWSEVTWIIGHFCPAPCARELSCADHGFGPTASKKHPVVTG